MGGNALKRTAESFGEHTTIHGLVYVLTKQFSIDRIIWAIIIICFAGISVHLSIETYTTWQDNPILTSIRKTNHPIEEISFPAVTICSSGLRTKLMEEALQKEFDIWAVNKTVTDKNKEKLTSEFLKEEYKIKPKTFSILSLVKAYLSPEAMKGSQDLLREQLVSCKMEKARQCTLDEKPVSVKMDTSLDCFIWCHRDTTCKSAVYDPSLLTCWNLVETTTITTLLGANCDSLELWISPSEVSYQPIKQYEKIPDRNCYEGNGGDPSVQGSGTYTGTSVEDCKLLCDSDLACEAFVYITDSADASFDQYRGMCHKRINFDEQNCPSDPNWSLYVPREYTNTELGVTIYQTLYNPLTFEPKQTSFLDTSCQLTKEEQEASENLPTIDLLINPKRKEELEELQKALLQPLQNYTQSLDQKLFEKVHNLIKLASQPCFEDSEDNMNSLLYSCEWRGKIVPCNQIFRQVVTDQGYCCAANLIQDDNHAENNATNHLQMVPMSGRQNGLKVVLDQHRGDIAFGTLYEDTEGFSAFIGSPDEFPMLTQRKIPLASGKEHSISLSAYGVIAEGVASVVPIKRGCYYFDEKKLDLFDTYSFVNCKMECALKQASEETSCTPWYLPRGLNNSAMCDPFTTSAFLTAMETAEVCDCLPDCSSITYTSSSSSSTLRGCDSRNLNLSPLCSTNSNTKLLGWLQSVKDIYTEKKLEVPVDQKKHLMDIRENYETQKMRAKDVFTNYAQEETYNHYDAFKKDISVVNIYFEESTIIEYERTLRYTLFNFIAALGGFFSLFLGFSIISILEIFYWFIFRFSREAINRPKASEKNHD